MRYGKLSIPLYYKVVFRLRDCGSSRRPSIVFSFEPVGFKVSFSMSFKWINYTSNYVDPGPDTEAAAKDAERTSASVVATASWTHKTSTLAIRYVF